MLYKGIQYEHDPSGGCLVFFGRNFTFTARASSEAEARRLIECAEASFTQPAIPDVARTTASDGFDEFWRMYPGADKRFRSDRYQAERQWGLLGCSTFARDIHAGLRKWLPELAGRSERFVAKPSTWLREQRWEDAPPENPDSESAKSARAASLATARRSYDRR